MPDEAVKVAVRVRPFNQREKDRGAGLIIGMQGKTTTIKNPDAPNEEPKQFAFDYSYWSHDGFSLDADGVMAADGPKYSSQQMVFDDLGQGVLDNAFAGYNCSLFAYGQTGSGKSYSMVGYGPNRGIVPITCDELFKTIEAGDGDTRYEVTFSMLEIYNEQVRDLLSKDNPKGGLQVRQNPKLGYFYVQNLKKVPVGSYKEIEKRMEQGTASRTVASTQMNATSSRAHTVVTITFDQILKTNAGETKKSSVMNLVDLAGSERADSTGATGDRLKEGANINKSLSALGNVISALADQSTGKKKVMVPYRDSVLTKLLQNALGGNSKTVMIAALSPANINYDETLGTLRYADRAKRIKNKAVVNENPMDKMIRELKEENDKLRKMIEGGMHPEASVQQGLSPEEIAKMKREMQEEIRAQLMANQEMLAEAAGSGPSWEEKLALARDETMVGDTTSQKSKVPHMVNLNEDPMLSGVVFHFFTIGETTVGRKDADPKPVICLNGLSIQKEHAVIVNTGSEIELRPGAPGSKSKINGTPITGPQVLAHKDRLLFGSNHLYVFINPLNPEEPEDVNEEINWEFAQKEIAQAKGFATGAASGLSKDQQIAQEQVLEILPMVSEVNAISEELNKHRTFEVVLISAAAQEGNSGKTGTKVMVKMKNLLNSNTWLWERGKFMNRRYLMQDMYQNYLDGELDISSIPKEEDPFWEPTEDVLIGTANVFLQSLGYALDFDDKLTIADYKAQEEGFLYVTVAPCNKSGKPLDDEYFVDNPQELLGKPYHFKVQIRSAEVNKARFSKGVRIKYRVFHDDEYVETPMVKGTLSPEFNHSKVFSYETLTQDHLEFFESGCITFCMYGIQEDTVADHRVMKMTTKELRLMEAAQQPAMQRRNTVFGLDNSDSSQLKSELLLIKRKFERLEQKEKRLQDLCREWSEKPTEEQDFEGFHRVISAVANSTGTKLKARVQVLRKVLTGLKFVRNPSPSTGLDVIAGQRLLQSRKVSPDGNHDNEDDTISLFVFGEDEVQLQNEANKNGGVLNHEHVSRYYGNHSRKPERLLQKQKGPSKGPPPAPSSNGHIKAPDGPKKEGSKACVIQ